MTATTRAALLILALASASPLASGGRLGPQTGSSSATSASPRYGRPALRALGRDPACARCHRQGREGRQTGAGSGSFGRPVFHLDQSPGGPTP